MKKKLLVYPLTDEILGLIRDKMFVAKYEKIMVSTYRGSGIDGLDCGMLDAGDNTGILVDEDFESLVQECDEVVLFENTRGVNAHSDVFEKKEYVESMGKTVYFISNNQKSSDLKEKEFFDSLKSIHIDITKDSSFDIEAEEFIEVEGLVDITTPIVGIVGNTENVGKFELQLQLKNELSRRGYKVSLIASNALCEFAGAYLYPRFMINTHYSDKMKILLFNRYLRYIELVDEPDLILVGVPGGIMPPTRRIVDDFGMLPIKTFKAAAPDYLILSMNYEEFKKDYFEELRKFVQYNYGCGLNAIKIKNSRIDWEDAEVTQAGCLLSYTIDMKNVTEVIEKMKKEIDMIFVTNNNESIVLLTDNIEDELEADEDVLVF